MLPDCDKDSPHEAIFRHYFPEGITYHSCLTQRYHNDHNYVQKMHQYELQGQR